MFTNYCTMLLSFFFLSFPLAPGIGAATTLYRAAHAIHRVVFLLLGYMKNRCACFCQEEARRRRRTLQNKSRRKKALSGTLWHSNQPAHSNRNDWHAGARAWTAAATSAYDPGRIFPPWSALLRPGLPSPVATHDTGQNSSRSGQSGMRI